MVDAVPLLLARIAGGEPQAARDLFPIVYAELRKLAARELAREAPGRTLQATALVHEVYLQLVGPAGERAAQWDSRGHFFASAARAMRQVLVEAARARGAEKRGGGRTRLALEQVELSVEDPPPELVDLDAALERFAEQEPVAAQLVELRFFAGLTQAEAAAALGLAATTAERHWVYARAWLYRALKDDDASGA